MPYLGAHLSIAGGVHKAVEAAVALGCDTVQLFTKSSNQWRARPLSEDEIASFRQAVQRAGLHFPTAHDSYLINLAAADDALFHKSVEAFVVELERAEALGLSYLVTHPGSHTGSGETAGIQRVAQGLNLALRRCRGFRVQVLLENTAGQGSTLGYRFEQLQAIRQRLTEPERVAYCFDTCHAFAAGYDLRTTDSLNQTLQEFDTVLGLDLLKVFHLNDSVRPLGSRVDRHAALGQGHIGTEAFRCLVQDPRFAAHPMILETPKEDSQGRPMDPVNLALLRSFLKSSPSATRSGKRR
ncbi:MAG: deoxyribonuclease IV [Gemmataceae bacterium]|nr:deoxyribonuclease IV [Gemmataceae bacterium]MCS7269444.1 deoxyribonuclease IV [Gemmataceae bacterium]MDW8242326.1 deoxyribonuclease IV [Thermogemmata sp.]